MIEFKTKFANLFIRKRINVAFCLMVLVTTSFEIQKSIL